VTKTQDAIRQFLDDDRSDELDAALLIARLLDERADVDGARLRLHGLGAAFAGTEPTAEAVCGYLEHAGFAGDEDYYALDNSRLDRVLERRRGIPITLAMVFLQVARAGSADAHGINCPGHFLVQVGDRLIDPYALCVVSNEEIQARWGGGRPVPLERATPVGVALRMLNNVRAILGSRQDHVGVLETIDHQLALTPQSAELHLARAEAWERLGSRDAARDALAEARRFAGADLRRHIDAVLQRLGGRGPVVH